MTAYAELLRQREELDQRIEEVRKSEMVAAIAQVRQIVAEFDLTPEDVFSSRAPRSSTKGTVVAPKYRNPETGQTWSGRGKAPKWIEGKIRDQFVI